MSFLTVAFLAEKYGTRLINQSKHTGVNMEMSKIRNVLRCKFGKRKYKITKDGKIHVYGVMPKTNAARQ